MKAAADTVTHFYIIAHIHSSYVEVVCVCVCVCEVGLVAFQTSKSLPSKEVQTQHMLERYLEGKAELLEPCVPGSLIYKDIMEEKARIRSNIRRRSNIGVNAMLRDARRKMNRRKPRSRREIVESLKEMIESELVDTNSEGPRQAQQPRRKASVEASVEASGTSQKPPVGSSTPRRPSLDQYEDSRSPRRSSLTLLGESNTPRSSLTQSGFPGDVGNLVRKSSLTKDKSSRDTNLKKRVTLPPVENGSRATGPKSNKDHLRSVNGPNTPRERSGSKADLILPQILEEREETTITKESTDGAPSSTVSSAHSRYFKREVQATSDGPTPLTGSGKRLPPLAKVLIQK